MRTFQEIVSEFIEEDDMRSYSGRGMFGRSCLGIDVESVLSFYCEIIRQEMSEDEREMVADIVESSKTDNMGKDYIIYFPNVSYDNTTRDHEDEQDHDDEELSSF